MRIISWLLVIGSCIAGAAELMKLQLPTLRWGFNTSRDFDFLHSGTGSDLFPWFGWLVTIFVLGLGLFGLYLFPKGFKFTPITQRRLQRFKEMRRGYVSLLILLVMGCIGAMDHLLVGNEALILKYEGKYHFPALVRDKPTAATFGETGDLAQAAPDYRKLKREFKKESNGNFVVMPIIPYAPTNDTLSALTMPLSEQNGLVLKNGKPFSGLAAKLYDKDNSERLHLRFRFRKGKPDGSADGWDEEGNRIYGANYKAGILKEEVWNGEGEKKDFLKRDSTELRQVFYNPSPPLPSEGHLLGTTPQGYDLLAYLYGGMQVNFKAALFYIPMVYVIGVSIGLLMGYFGGNFDIIVQRLIEVFSNIPFLFVIIIVSTAVPEKYKGLGIILIILVLFGWMGMTYLMRAAALKEKARDYVMASRVAGASTSRVLFKHILPNSIAIIVTLIPFSISGVILSLTSLDYLGFGLPPKYATWGRLLSDGLENLSSPWLVTSAFFALVALLVLVTFVGEAVREAFDPKKFTLYR